MAGQIAADLLIGAGAIQPKPLPYDPPAPDDDRWGEILDLSYTHGMRPLLARFLRICHPGNFPPALHDFVSLNLRHNLRKTGALIELLRLFRSESLPVVSYKGPALADVAYGGLELREFADLDLLIDKADIVRCRDLLESAGYRASMPFDTPGLESFVQHCNVLDFWREETQVSVEVHWELSPRYLPFKLTVQDILRRAAVAHPGGMSVPTLSHEDTLLFLCLHGAKHGWERLSWICDLGWLLHRHPEIDWDQVLVGARHCRSERILRLALILATKVTRVDLPPEIQRFMLSDARAASLASEIIVPIFEGKQSPAATARLIVAMQPSLARKLHTTWLIATTPSAADWLAFRHLPFPPYTYPFFRPLRLLGRLHPKNE